MKEYVYIRTPSIPNRKLLLRMLERKTILTLIKIIEKIMNIYNIK
jgi:hypothetical protein